MQVNATGQHIATPLIQLLCHCWLD